MGVPYFDFGVELSAPARGAMVWGILREIGVEGVRARVVADNDFARHVAQRAHQHPRLEVLAEPVLSICGFRYLPKNAARTDDVNQQILRRLARETQVVVSSTIVNGSFVLRPSCINARTEMKHVDEFIDYVISFGDELDAAA
jgi:aromatic-L-amino-acid decarboxylase